MKFSESICRELISHSSNVSAASGNRGLQKADNDARKVEKATDLYSEYKVTRIDNARENLSNKSQAAIYVSG